jgi:hypothetical protein
MKKYVPHIIIFLVLIIGASSLTMNRPLGHDEHMYISAGMMVDDSSIYRDFAYLQTPYLPYLYGLVYTITGESALLLKSRLLSFGFFIISLIFVYLICLRLTKDVFVSLWSSCIFAFSHSIIHVIPYAWNHLLPLTTTIMTVYFFTAKYTNRSHRNLNHFLAGLLLGVSIGMKLTYALIPLGFLAAVFFQSRASDYGRRPLKDAVWLLAGLVLGIVPMLMILIRAGYDLFLFNNWTYHNLNTIWRQTEVTGYSEGMTMGGKALFVWQEMTYPTALALLMGLIFTAAYQMVRQGQDFWRGIIPALQSRETILIIACFIISFVTSVSPAPLFISYFAAPVTFAILLLAIGLGRIDIKDRWVVRTVLIALFIGGVLGGVKLFRDAPQLTSVNNWTPIRVEKAAEVIYDNTRHFRKKPVIATLSPLYALEGRCDICRELATGPFLFRVGDLLSEGQLRQYIGTSPGRLGDVLDEYAPEAILVGRERELEDPFIDFARRHKYNRIEIGTDNLILYVRTDGSFQQTD